MATEEIRIIDDALKILGALIMPRQTGDEGLSQEAIEYKVGLTKAACEAVLEFLIGHQFVEATYGHGSIWITPDGISYYDSKRNLPPSIHVGAIFQCPVNDAQIQAVGSAVNSSVQRVANNVQADDVRQALIQAVESMIRAVQGELTAEQFISYTQIARQFQQEVTKENPDKAWLRRAESILSFMSDVEGTIQFGERTFYLSSHVVPYVPLLITLLARLWS
jgi:hypothetical protein